MHAAQAPVAMTEGAWFGTVLDLEVSLNQASLRGVFHVDNL